MNDGRIFGIDMGCVTAYSYISCLDAVEQGNRKAELRSALFAAK